MAKIKRLEAIKDYSHVYEYKCECGKLVELQETGKPDRLVKCFNCQNKYETGLF